ncbi:TetR/AcrR family transcriptional regulator [Brachybacterium sp. GCM10030268]|uniref:TetR/AcrR family transcriptional regulator n=1 Tax=Brachybacterium sp. GCM10030268 TaxID=3273382 RepID=UPI00360A99B8
MPAAASTPDSPSPSASTPVEQASSARERILDAAATIMRRDGLVRATTRLIAQEAGCSEALLYKHFPDKREIFLGVLTERSPRIDGGGDLPGTGTVAGNLAQLVANQIAFYEQSFPIAASIFSSTELLVAHREAMADRGVGPHGPSALLARYLEKEVELERLPRLDTDAVALLLTGAALHEAFLATYAGESIQEPGSTARRLVDALDLTGPVGQYPGDEVPSGS